MKGLTILWLLFMTTLSHMPGEPSGAESKWLSSMTGVKEGTLRRGAHVLCFLILALLTMVAWPTSPLWIKIAALVAWAVIDEASKIPIPGRHFSWTDVGLNVIGILIGLGIGALIV